MKTFKIIIIPILVIFSIFLAIMFCTKNMTTSKMATSKNPQYKIVVSAKVITNTTSSGQSPYYITMDYLSNSKIVETYSYAGNNPLHINNDKILTGKIIGVKFTLIDYNSNNQNSERLVVVEDITIRIINNDTGEVLLNKVGDETFNLFIKYDTVCSGTILFHPQTNTYRIVKSDWGL